MQVEVASGRGRRWIKSSMPPSTASRSRRPVLPLMTLFVSESDQPLLSVGSIARCVTIGLGLLAWPVSGFLSVWPLSLTP